MKVLYVTTMDFSLDSGVRKKIIGQVKAMRKAGLETELFVTSGNEVGIYGIQGKFESYGVYKKIKWLGFLLMKFILYRKAFEYFIEKDFNAVYIRYSLSDPMFISFIKKLKTKGIRVFVEIASYPYDSEYKTKSLIKKLALQVDKVYRGQLKKYVDTVCTPAYTDKAIWGVRTVLFSNAVDMNSVIPRDYSGKKKDTLRILGLANLNPWHGYDRIIKGIYEYYESGGRKNIEFHVVGEGLDFNHLNDLTNELGLRDQVMFYGSKFGEELNKIYNSIDVGVGAIALFRVKASSYTTLKAREYTMKGIPFIDVRGDPAFPKDFKYIYKVDNNDTPVNIKEVYNWFEHLNPKEYMSAMREYALKNLGWDTNFKSVISAIKKDN